MKTTYKVRLSPDPLIIRVQDSIEEIIFGLDKYISLAKSEMIVRQLNKGEVIDFDSLT